MKKLALLLLVLIAIACGIIFWQRSQLPGWISQKIKNTINEEFLRGTHGELTELRFEADFLDFLLGKAGRLSFQLRYGSLLAKGNGSIKIHLASDQILFQYLPLIEVLSLETGRPFLEPAMKIGISGQIPTSNPSESTLDFVVEEQSVRLPSLNLEANPAGKIAATTRSVDGSFQAAKRMLTFYTAGSKRRGSHNENFLSGGGFPDGR
jgi:hypothetical protein